VRIINLSENTAGQPDLLAEWGASFLIEADEKNILLDTGLSISVTQNADRMGIDLQRTDCIVLSHGHYDHTGGLRSLLTRLKRKITIIGHPDIWNDEYSRREGKPDKYIGIPYRRQELESLGANFVLSKEPVKITTNVQTSGEIPMTTDFEKIEKNFYLKTAQGWEPDQLRDDLAVVINTPGGLVVALGCGHRGIINTLYHARNVTGIKKVRLTLGGCHLKEASDEQIWQTVSALNEMEVQKLALSHCTGMRATLILAQTYGENFIFNNTGTIINL
jgi:7,8-dihydropterin-6-yl-methyl-4-(beta-D-ribofuranosyl)aminobenzene 5'-phosphate synthase